MPIVSTADSAISIRALNRNSLMKRILRESGLGDYGTATSGDTNFLIDTTKLKSDQYSSDEWVDGWVRASKDFSSSGSALENSIAPITTYTPSSGTIAFNPTFSVAFAVSDEYELWKGLHPKTVTDIIDQCLTKDIALPYWAPLSEVPDYDMEQSGTSDWSTSNATIAKTTTTRSRGKNALTVTTTSANGYAQTSELFVEPGKQYFAMASVVSGSTSTTSKLIAYDNTNSAEIATKSITRRSIAKLWIEFTAPSGCYSISLRLSNVESSVVSSWDDIIFFCFDQRVVSLPWWIRSDNQVKGVFELDINDLTSNNAADEIVGELDNRWDFTDSGFGNYNKLKLKARYGTMHKPLYIFGVRNETAYSNDNTDYKMVDEDYIATCVLYRIYQHLANQPTSGYLDSKEVKTKLVEYKKAWMDMMNIQNQRLEQVLRTPSTRAYFNHPTDRLGWY